MCVWFWNREEKRYVRVPKNIEDAKKLGAVLSHYKEQYYHQVLIAYFTSYVLYPLVHTVVNKLTIILQCWWVLEVYCILCKKVITCLYDLRQSCVYFMYLSVTQKQVDRCVECRYCYTLFSCLVTLLRLSLIKVSISILSSVISWAVCFYLTREQFAVVCYSWLNISEYSVWIPVSVLTCTFPRLHGNYEFVLYHNVNHRNC